MKLIKSVMDWLRGLFETTQQQMINRMVHDNCPQCLRAVRITNRNNRIASLNNRNLLERHGYQH